MADVTVGFAGGGCLEESIIRSTPPGKSWEHSVFPGSRLFAACLDEKPGSLGIRKTPLPHIHGTKALYTSAIPPKLTFPAKCPLATRTIIRAPMDNGWGPVSFYLTVYSFKAALRSPFTDCLTLRFHPPELSVDPHLSATTLLHRFLCLMLFVLYARFSGLSIVF